MEHGPGVALLVSGQATSLRTVYRARLRPPHSCPVMDCSHVITQDFQSGLGQTEVSGSRETVASLEGAPGAFHRRPNAAAQVNGGPFGLRAFLIPCGLVQDAVRKAPERKHVPVQPAAVPPARVTAPHRLQPAR